MKGYPAERTVIMKKTLALLIAVFMALSVLAACAKTEENTRTDGIDASQFKTFADVFSYVKEDWSYESSYDDQYYVYAFGPDEPNYRAIAALTQGTRDKLYNLEYDDNWDQNLKDIIGPLEITEFEDLHDRIPTKDDLDKYIGKTGGELFDAGWSYWYYNLEDMEAGLSYKEFEYTVAFEYDGEQMVNTDDFDFEEEFRDLKVKSVTYDGIGNAVYIDEE
jgi:hypothetical protein